jgi:hypothetical protein
MGHQPLQDEGGGLNCFARRSAMWPIAASFSKQTVHSWAVQRNRSLEPESGIDSRSSEEHKTLLFQYGIGV